MNKYNKVLFIAPHPDDETLGCGGTILKYKDNGSKIYWLIVTCAHSQDGFKEDDIKIRKDQIKKVKKDYGFDGLYELKLRTTQLDTYNLSELIGHFKNIFHELKPDTIFLPHRYDVHSDHRIIFETVWASSKTFRSPFIKNIFSYETISETEYASPESQSSFTPNVFIDITDYFEKKLKISQNYFDEILDHPFPRSLENLQALARFRGSTIFTEYAEAFMCLKSIR